jgi:uncharacterized membrane protein YbhN (UPF0104 family)
MKMPKKALFALKLSLTVILCAIIVWKADWSGVAEGLRAARPVELGLVFAAMVLCVSISACKWQMLLRIHGAAFRFLSLHRWYFVAMFFNNFLPTSIGGDGYRIYKTLGNNRSKTAAVLAVFVERISGILSLLLLGFAGAAIGYLGSDNPLSRTVFLGGLIGVAVGVPALLVFFHRGVLDWLSRHPRIPAVVRNVFMHLDDYRSQPRQTVGVILISFGFHAFSLSWMWLLFHAVGAPIAFTDLAVLAALLAVVAVLPLSINGIGLVDGSLIFLAGQFGVDYDAALTVALLQRALLIPISLFGGALYFLDRRTAGPAPDAEGLEAES